MEIAKPRSEEPEVGEFCLGGIESGELYSTASMETIAIGGSGYYAHGFGGTEREEGGGVEEGKEKFDEERVSEVIGSKVDFVVVFCEAWVPI